MRPELFSVRAVNQYKHRDIIAYLGLRYYLQSDCSTQDVWIQDIAAHLVQTRSKPIYFKSKHFKKISKGSDDEFQVVHRDIYVPGPNEMLAEAYLLNVCSKFQNFRSADFVYSYRFPDSRSKEGIFKSYFQNFQRRNEYIQKICEGMQEADTKVIFTDIKKFYPSISSELAKQSWKDACDSSDVPNRIRAIGDRLLDYHFNISRLNDDCAGLLTGPMFSHAVANMVLSKIDYFMSERTNGKYCRYVDDFVLIGTAEEVRNERAILEGKLKELGLVLHDEEKDFEIDSRDWIECQSNPPSVSYNLWNYFIADLKRFLLVNPELRDSLAHAFSSEGIRIPLLDYSAAVEESSYLERFSDWLNKYPWGLKSVKSLSIANLVGAALRVRDTYEKELKDLLNTKLNTNPYYKKQLVSGARFCAKRLAYLSTDEVLKSVSSGLSMFSELSLQSKIIDAIYTKDISEIIRLGSDASQAVAEVMDAGGIEATCTDQTLSDVCLQSLAIFNFYEVRIKLTETVRSAMEKDSLCQFSLYENEKKLMKTDNLFIQELACLRGLNNRNSHKTILNSAFDRNEELCLSIIDKCQGSEYY